MELSPLCQVQGKVLAYRQQDPLCPQKALFGRGQWGKEAALQWSEGWVSEIGERIPKEWQLTQGDGKGRSFLEEQGDIHETKFFHMAAVRESSRMRRDKKGGLMADECRERREQNYQSPKVKLRPWVMGALSSQGQGDGSVNKGACHSSLEDLSSDSQHTCKNLAQFCNLSAGRWRQQSWSSLASHPS